MPGKTVYRGRVLNLTVEMAQLPNGKSVELELIRHPGASAVVPLRDDGNVVMIRQYRHAAGGLIDEIPAGKLDQGELPLSCAKRELQEEVGMRADRWHHLGTIFTTPGFTDEQIHLYLAQGLRAGEVAHDPDEYIEVTAYPLEEVVRLIREGRITDGKTICAIMLAYFYVFDVKHETWEKK
jgi:ADP-ribose pyrophosphatase